MAAAEKRASKRAALLARHIRRFPAFLAKPVSTELAAAARLESIRHRWMPGRQGTGYEKLDIRAALAAGELEQHQSLLESVLSAARVSFSVEIAEWDAYFLRFGDGAFIPEHRDAVGDRAHLRLNSLISSSSGTSGQLRFSGTVFDLTEGDAVMFRPDLVPHRVSAVTGSRLVLSVGCVYHEKDEKAE